MPKLYLAYDYESFEFASTETIVCTTNIHYWLEYAWHDLTLGYCFQFKIYNEYGEVVFESLPSRVAA